MQVCSHPVVFKRNRTVNRKHQFTQIHAIQSNTHIFYNVLLYQLALRWLIKVISRLKQMISVQKCTEEERNNTDMKHKCEQCVMR